LTAQFDLDEADRLYRQLRREKGGDVLIDCSNLAVWPTARLAFLTDLLRRLDRRRIAWSLNGAPENVQRGVDYLLYQSAPAARRLRDEKTPLVDETLSRTLRLGRDVVATMKLLEDIVFWSLLGPFFRHGFRYGRTLYEITERGMRSMPIVALVAGTMGLVLAMQAAAQLRTFGAAIYVANLVGISMIRELGPLLSSVLMAGRSGSAIAAEIGSMVSTEEMDALRAMGVSVTKYIVVPKFVALVIVLPCLAVFADIIGLAGGYAFSVLQLGIPSAEYIEQTASAVRPNDVLIGLVKSAADAVIIATVAVHQGLTTTGGAEGIGKSTTKSVVHSIVLIAIAHLFFTALFYYTGHTVEIRV